MTRQRYENIRAWRRIEGWSLPPYEEWLRRRGEP